MATTDTKQTPRSDSALAASSPLSDAPDSDAATTTTTMGAPPAKTAAATPRGSDATAGPNTTTSAAIDDAATEATSVSDDALLDMLLAADAADDGVPSAKRRRLTMAARRELNAPPPMMKPSYYRQPGADAPLNTPLQMQLVVNAAKRSLMRSFTDEGLDTDILDDLPSAHRDLFARGLIETPKVMPPPTKPLKTAPKAAVDAAVASKRKRGQPVHFTFDEVVA